MRRYEYTVDRGATWIALPTTGTFINATFRKPANDGGEMVDYYAYSLDGGTTWITWGRFAQSPHPIRGLKLNAKYFVMVRAHNSAGWGPASNIMSASTKK